MMQKILFKSKMKIHIKQSLVKF